MPPRPEAIILRLAPFAPLVSHRVWLHAQVMLLGARLAPGARTVTAALRVMGLAAARHLTNDHRVLNRATGSARHGRRMLLGFLITPLVPPGATMVRGADDTVARRSGRQSTATGGDREAVRSSQTPVSRGVGLPWVSMLRWVPGPGSRRVWALPLLTAWCGPAAQALRHRHNTRVEWVRPIWRPPQGRSCWGWSCAGRSRSPVKKPAPILVSRPNASGRTKPWPAPPPSWWDCAHWAPCWPCSCPRATRFQCRRRRGITTWRRPSPTVWPGYVRIAGVPGMWCTLRLRQSRCHFHRRYWTS